MTSRPRLPSVSVTRSAATLVTAIPNDALSRDHLNWATPPVTLAAFALV